jgi:hypothetical protein
MEYDDQSKKDVERDEVGNKRLSSSLSAAAPRHTAAKPNLLQTQWQKMSAVSHYLVENPTKY